MKRFYVETMITCCMICTNFAIFVWCHKLRFLPFFWNAFLDHYFSSSPVSTYLIFPCAEHYFVFISCIIFMFCVVFFFWICVFSSSFDSLVVVVVVNAKAIQYIWHPIVSIFTHSIHFEFSALFIYFHSFVISSHFSFFQTQFNSHSGERDPSYK